MLKKIIIIKKNPIYGWKVKLKKIYGSQLPNRLVAQLVIFCIFNRDIYDSNSHFLITTIVYKRALKKKSYTIKKKKKYTTMVKIVKTFLPLILI